MSHRARLLVALVSTGLIGYIAVGSLLARVLGDTSYGQLAIFNEVVRLVIDSYVEPVNVDRAMAGARLGMADALDGDSSYLDPEEFRLYEQAPREADGEVGLLLRSIDDRHTRPMPAVVADRLLRGAPGSSVKLGILRAGADPFDVPVVRERVLPVAPTGRMLEGGTGYVQVADFGPNVVDDVRARVEALKREGASRLVLDLRSAAWG